MGEWGIEMATAATTLAPRPVTFADAAQVDPDDFSAEIVDGRWEPVSKSTWGHGEIVMTLSGFLWLYAREHPGWSMATGDPGTKLGRSPDTLRGPDIGVVRAERRPTGRGEAGWLEGAPDVAVEVVGDAQTATEVTRKGLEYLDAGARLVWVVDRDARLVIELTPPRQLRILGPEDALEGGEVLPGFRCPLAQIFPPADAAE
jgi:Uma2 family endonuclease